MLESFLQAIRRRLDPDQPGGERLAEGSLDGAAPDACQGGDVIEMKPAVAPPRRSPWLRSGCACSSLKHPERAAHLGLRRRAFKIQARLGNPDASADDWPPRLRGMRQDTYNRLMDRLTLARASWMGT